MKTDLFLSRIWGQVDALLTLPINRPLGPDGSNRVAGWSSSYFKRGLSFASCRAEVEALRELVGAGLLEGSGATQSKSHRLTTAGLCAAVGNCGMDFGESKNLLNKITEEQATSAVWLPADRSRKLCMGWMLLPEAGEWFETANATDANWKRYTEAQGRLQDALSPLLALGLVKLYASADGQVWGLSATPEAHCWTPPTMPDITEEQMEAHFQAWSEGYDVGQAHYASATPPLEFSGMLARSLPSTAWC